MFRFLVFKDGVPAASWPLRNAYMIDSDGNAVRCELSFKSGSVICRKRESGSAALALQYPVGDLGELTIQTCLLPERDEPYLLSLELARHQLMTLYSKMEDWALFDLEQEHPVPRRMERGRSLFIEALSIQEEDPARAECQAAKCLSVILDGCEELALAHSELLLNRRKRSAALPSRSIGCGVGLRQAHNRVRSSLTKNFDFVQLPMPWKHLAPAEGEYNWSVTDDWAQWATQNKVPVVAGPIISFDPRNLPDWLYIWEHDYDTVRDLIYEHVERVVNRYKMHFYAWNVISGLHVNQYFTFNFEQLMDLTRMTTMLAKKIAPSSQIIIELRHPFGEYYAHNQRSIPPLMYADLVAQSGIGFDLFGIRLAMGQAKPGQYTRDLMQMSNLLDRFQPFNKPLHLTVAAPSGPVTGAMLDMPASNEPFDDNSGYWRQPWSELVQSHWLEAALQISISKPMVDAVAWQDLADCTEMDLPLSGLVSEQMKSKGAMRRLSSFRQKLHQDGDVDGDPVVSISVPGTAEADLTGAGD